MWWIRRLTCWLGGHHDLCLAAAYGEILPSGRSKELHYCARCGRAVWTSPPATGISLPRRDDIGRPIKYTRLLVAPASRPLPQAGRLHHNAFSHKLKEGT